MGADIFITFLVCAMTGLGVYIALEYQRSGKDKNSRKTLKTAQEETTHLKTELQSFKQYAQHLAQAQKALSEQLPKLSVTVKREGIHVETLSHVVAAATEPQADSKDEKEASAPKTAATAAAPTKVVVRFEAQYVFGFPSPSKELEITTDNTGIAIKLDRPKLSKPPVVRPLPYADIGKVSTTPAHVDVVKKLPSIAEKQGSESALDETVMALLEKKLCHSLVTFLSQQPGVAHIPQISVVYH
jgi:hypothetical protein